MLAFKQVSFTLPNGKKILDDLNITINTGDFVVILGSNGSGKSSLLKLIHGDYKKTTGELCFKNKIIDKTPKAVLHEKIASLNQHTAGNLFMDLTVEENARLIDLKTKKTWAGRQTFRQQLIDCLKQYHVNLEQCLKTQVSSLSGGQQQILSFALYLRHQPDLLLLDEHTSALDPKTAIKVMKYTQQVISDKKLTCLMTTHNLEFALHYGNRIIVMQGGKIIKQLDEGEKKQLNKQALIEYCY